MITNPLRRRLNDLQSRLSTAEFQLTQVSEPKKVLLWSGNVEYLKRRITKLENCNDMTEFDQLNDSDRMALENLRVENEQSFEYFNRKFHWNIGYTGVMSVPAYCNFHPNHYHGTEQSLDEIIVRFLRGKEGQFKIGSISRFDTAVELDQKFNIKNYK